MKNKKKIMVRWKKGQRISKKREREKKRINFVTKRYTIASHEDIDITSKWKFQMDVYECVRTRDKRKLTI